MPQWARLVTDWPAGQAEEFVAALESGALHPMEAKKQLGHRIAELYHGSNPADAAQQAFERTHQLGASRTSSRKWCCTARCSWPTSSLASAPPRRRQTLEGLSQVAA